MSMDVLLALITKDFDKSNWTAQEIGFVLGRNVPVVQLKMVWILWLFWKEASNFWERKTAKELHKK